MINDWFGARLAQPVVWTKQRASAGNLRRFAVRHIIPDMDSLLDNWPVALEGFEPLEVLAVGRLSTVVRATEAQTGRQVALKVLHNHLAGQPPVRRRLRREFAAVCRLDHPAIVGAEDLIEESDTVALVMDYVPGVSVREYVNRKGPMGWQQARQVLDDVLSGVEHAHKTGVWHRDLNAEHVLVDEEGRGRIVGFGMARVDELAALTMHTRVLGALEAMAPERVLGMDYDGRADLYSVGAVGYEMLVGHPPIEGTMRSAIEHAGTSVGEQLPEELPDEATYLLERSLVADPSVRFATPAQMRRAIDGVYDRQMWNGWASRHTETCPECDHPIIDAIDTCLECGYRFHRLIRQPGGNDWKVVILSRADTFVPDTAFEANMEPRKLTEREFQSLMEMLAEHDDTRRFAHGGSEYRDTPYVLAQDLTAADARRICEQLDKRNIQHKMFNDRDEGRTVPAAPRIRGGRYRTEPATRFRVVMMFTVVAVVAMLMGLTSLVPLPDGAVIGAVTLFAAGLLLGKVGMTHWWGAASAGSEISTTSEAALIPTEELTPVGRLSGRDVVPDRLASAFDELEDEAVRRELFELTVLAVDAGSQLKHDEMQHLRLLLEEIAGVGQWLDDAKCRLDEESTPMLIDELESINRRLDAADDVDEELKQQRERLLDRLQRQDEEAADVAALQARLLRVRGRLLDMRGDVWEQLAREEVVLDFGERPEEVIDGLRMELEAQQQVEQLV